MSIDFDLADGIATITINRPERMNAMDAEHYRGLSEAWRRVRDDNEIRVAIVTGAGEKSFSAGADIKSFLTAPTGLDEMWLTQKDQLLNRGLEVWKPVIAAVNGYCLAGGMTLLMATDIRIAAPHATFNIAEVKRGIVPGNGGTQRILEQLPYPIAMEMLLTGDAIDAATAAQHGLINKIVPMDELMATARAYAKRIAANAPLAVQAAKELAVRARDMDRNTGFRVEALVNRLLQCTEDAREGPKAFAEKRPPQFKGA
ncbi:enoyl-CoA hydratase/isomerase family protein [Falsiroseomonas sp.]|uniref:enoyl-CoA hydratase/isomerase family protein n=1 Tax=Falsiroseomonas sp. TaxID=2870721 RepID=UPI002727630E|nr:enoyl-CoA hydratase-related protein [Falsiroseomonas sp.]MDO9499301.1 enoyl-CoA hydratase-related protein [Falsiroseomonas sp.]